MESVDFSKIFHESSKDHQKGHPLISSDQNDWPEEWKTTFYKDYPRLTKINLEDNAPKSDIFDIIKKRKSSRDFTRAPISKREISLLLKYSCGNIGPFGKDRKRRAQPSGGGLFPIEAYPIVFRPSTSSGQVPDSDLPAGLYHYNVKDHALDILWDREFNNEEIDKLFTYPWVKDASAVILMTSVFFRNQNKYGERGYRYILHEAGHIGQNIYLVCEALGMKCCALGGTEDKKIEELIDVDGITESLVYAIAVGK